MMRRTAHHTSGEAKPLTPVQDHALSVSATSVAPRFKRNSDTSTHATLRASCSQGFPKPEGRFCICFFPSFVMSSKVETSLIVLRATREAKTKGQRFLHFGRNDKRQVLRRDPKKHVRADRC